MCNLNRTPIDPITSDIEMESETEMEMHIMLELMVDAGVNGISYFKLVAAGIEDPGHCADRLRELGAIIKEKQRPAIDNYKIMVWDEVTHFIYKRWNYNIAPL